MSNDNVKFFQYERCPICDGRGLIEIHKKRNPTPYNEISQCDICLGTGQLKIQIKKRDL